jgi:glycerate kinase
VVAVAGRVALDEATWRSAGFDAAYGLIDEAGSREEAFDAPGPLLERIGARIAREYGEVLDAPATSRVEVEVARER